MKDNFSKVADLYARFRPGYPGELVSYLVSRVPGRESAWDCGTGSGQFAVEIAPAFATVVATDVSADQIANAQPAPNIRYSVGSAESSAFPDESFDLVCAAQAVHWFDFGRLYREVYRVLKPGGVFAVAGYSLCSIGPVLDPVLLEFYAGAVGPYWDPERRYVDERYRTIPFPFLEIPAPEFTVRLSWDLEEFLGYVRTWSAVQHYIDATGADPIAGLRAALAPHWQSGARREIVFPFFLRMGTRAQRQTIRSYTGLSRS